MELAVQRARAFIILARPYNSILPVFLVYIGGVLSNASQGVLLLGIVLYVVAHSVVTVANDIEDASIDKDNKRNLQPLAILTPKYAWWIVWLATGCTIIVSSIFLPWLVTLLFCLLFFISWAYNSRPFLLSRRPVASIIVLGLGYALLPFFMGINGAYNFHPTITPIITLLSLGVCFTLGRMSLSILKDYKDAVGDAKHHKKTYLLVFGGRQVQLVSFISAGIGYIGSSMLVYLLVGNGMLLLLALIVGLWLMFERRKLSSEKTYSQLNTLFHRFLRYELIFYGIIAAWVTISLV